METIDIPKVQARFFGLSYPQAQSVIMNLNHVVERLGSGTQEGKLVIEAQGLLDDLSIYAEKIRMHEAQILAAIAGSDNPDATPSRPRNHPRKKNTMKKRRPHNKGRGARNDS